MLGHYLQEMRVANRLSLNLLSQRAGISRITLWRWEREETLPRRIELQAILEALEATPEQRRSAMKLYSDHAPHRIEWLQTRQGATHLHRGDLLIALRGRRGWTQEEAAARAGVPRTTLARWENLTTWPSHERLHQLCYAYGVTTEELLTLTSWKPMEAHDTLPNLEALRATVATWAHTVYQLNELECLAVAGRLDMMAQEHEAALELLCTVFLYYANHLINRYRLQEAGAYLRRANALLPSAERSPSFLHCRLDAYLTRMRFRSDRRLTRERSAQLACRKLAPLEAALAELPTEQQSVVLGDLAVNMATLRRHDEADRLSAEALRLARQVAAGEIGMLLAQQRLLERCWVLSEAGRYAEALAALPQFSTGIEFNDAYFAVVRGKTLMAAGSATEGQMVLEQAIALGKARDWPAITVGATEALQTQGKITN